MSERACFQTLQRAALNMQARQAIPGSGHSRYCDEPDEPSPTRKKLPLGFFEPNFFFFFDTG
jgi:hypothetical protein